MQKNDFEFFQHLIEYAIDSGEVSRMDNLAISGRFKIEQSAYSTSFLLLPSDQLLVANDQFKFKIFNIQTFSILHTFLAPFHDGPIRNLTVSIWNIHLWNDKITLWVIIHSFFQVIIFLHSWAIETFTFINFRSMATHSSIWGCLLIQWNSKPYGIWKTIFYSATERVTTGSVRGESMRCKAAFLANWLLQFAYHI